MGKRVAVLQSSYLPWKGYFDIIHDVDLFVFYDDVQFTTRDWRSRNRLKTSHGAAWLTIPLGSQDRRPICEVELPPGPWAERHWRQIETHYRRAPYFAEYGPLLEELLLVGRPRMLWELNQRVIGTVARDVLGIATVIEDSRAYSPRGRKLERMIDLLRRVGATTYVSGPAARAYLDEEALAAAGMAVEWKDYSGYPEYPQFHPPFLHQVFVFDLLFHAGPRAPELIWGWRSAAAGTASGAAR